MFRQSDLCRAMWTLYSNLSFSFSCKNCIFAVVDSLLVDITLNLCSCSVIFLSVLISHICSFFSVCYCALECIPLVCDVPDVQFLLLQIIAYSVCSEFLSFAFAVLVA